MKITLFIGLLKLIALGIDGNLFIILMQFDYDSNEIHHEVASDEFYFFFYYVFLLGPSNSS